jgi:hypothetical protein
MFFGKRMEEGLLRFLRCDVMASVDRLMVDGWIGRLSSILLAAAAAGSCKNCCTCGSYSLIDTGGCFGKLAGIFIEYDAFSEKLLPILRMHNFR